MAEILLGTSVSGRAEAAAREAPAQDSLAALSSAGTAVCVNLTFHDDPPAASPLERCRHLRLDARLVSGVSGPRKPVVSEMLDVLASEAERRGIRRIGIVNGDIVVTPAAVEHAVITERSALAIARTDRGGDEPDALLRHGIDMFTFDVGVWRRERRRFRAYLLGEPVWDNVYAAVAVCHGGEIVNRAGLLLHTRASVGVRRVTVCAIPADSGGARQRVLQPVVQLRGSCRGARPASARRRRRREAAAANLPRAGTRRRRGGHVPARRGGAQGRRSVPELPDVELYLAALRPRVIGRAIERVRVASPFFVRTYDPPLPAIAGHAIVSLSRLGKRLVFALDADLFVVVHLMIAGPPALARARRRDPGEARPRGVRFRRRDAALHRGGIQETGIAARRPRARRRWRRWTRGAPRCSR